MLRGRWRGWAGLNVTPAYVPPFGTWRDKTKVADFVQRFLSVLFCQANCNPAVLCLFLEEKCSTSWSVVLSELIVVYEHI